MSIYFDGGLRKNLVCMVDKDTNLVRIRKRKEHNSYTYEYDALEIALDYAKENKPDMVEFIGDSNEAVKFIRAVKKEDGNLVKARCIKKLKSLNCDISAVWVERRNNLAGRVLEHYTRSKPKEMDFYAHWYHCPYCEFKSLIEKEKEEHFWNRHLVYSS